MEVDLDLSDSEIRQFVIQQCSKLGTVVSVRIDRHPSPAAVVDMADKLQSLALAVQFGGMASGGSIHIALKHKIP